MPIITIAGNLWSAEKCREAGEQVLTISGCKQEEIKDESGNTEKKWVVRFHEVESGVSLNATRVDQLKNITGEMNSDNWAGKAVILYCDEEVRFGSKKVGGVAFKGVGEAVTPSLFTKPVK